MAESTELSEWGWDFEPTREGLIRAIDSMNCGLLVESADGLILYANSQVLEWTGYQPREIDHQSTRLVVPAEFHSDLDKERQRVLDGDMRSRLSALKRKDGRTFPVVVAPRAGTNAKGQPVVLCVIIDLGEVQTARPIGAADDSLASELAGVALKLQTLSFSASVAREGGVPADHPLLDELSAREREVLELLVQGSRVPAIAEKLFISQNTVRNHLKAVFRKAGVSSQSALIERVRSRDVSGTRGGS